jgi:FdhD protein
MRTPGSDVELSQGFLLTEGVIAHRDDLLAVRHCRGAAGPYGVNTYNVLDVTLAGDVPPPAVDITATSTRRRRAGYAARPPSTRCG